MVNSAAIIYLLELLDLGFPFSVAGFPLSVVGSQDAVKKSPSFLIKQFR
jgi:hypothetical protein